MKATLWGLGVFLILLILGIGLLSFAETIHWVGGKPLKIQFLVIDARTRRPIPSAQISIYPSRGSLCDCDVQEPLSFSTDDKGEATRWCRDCQCGGTRTWGKSTFYMCLPSWYVTAKAPGYSETDPGLYLDSAPNRRGVDRGNEYATLKVSLELSTCAKK